MYKSRTVVTYIVATAVFFSECVNDNIYARVPAICIRYRTELHPVTFVVTRSPHIADIVACKISEEQPTRARL